MFHFPGLVFWFRDKYVGPFQKCTHNRAFVFDVMIRFEVQVLVGVGWFSVHGDMSAAVVINVYTGVQEGEDPVAFWFGCENNVRVNTVDMSCELLYVVFMDLGERVIHVPEPQGWRVIQPRRSGQLPVAARRRRRDVFESLRLQAKKRLLKGNNFSTITMTESDNNIYAVMS